MIRVSSLLGPGFCASKMGLYVFFPSPPEGFGGCRGSCVLPPAHACPVNTNSDVASRSRASRVGSFGVSGRGVLAGRQVPRVCVCECV